MKFSNVTDAKSIEFFFFICTYAVLRGPQSSPYLGYELVLRTSADQHKWSSENSLYVVLTIFKDFMRWCCVLTEAVVYQFFIHSVALLVLHKDSLMLAPLECRKCRKKSVRLSCLILSA